MYIWLSAFAGSPVCASATAPRRVRPLRRDLGHADRLAAAPPARPQRSPSSCRASADRRTARRSPARRGERAGRRRTAPHERHDCATVFGASSGYVSNANVPLRRFDDDDRRGAAEPRASARCWRRDRHAPMAAATSQHDRCHAIASSGSCLRHLASRQCVDNRRDARNRRTADRRAGTRSAPR